MTEAERLATLLETSNVVRTTADKAAALLRSLQAENETLQANARTDEILLEAAQDAAQRLKTENEALQRANLDCVDHFDAIKVDYEALRVKEAMQKGLIDGLLSVEKSLRVSNDKLTAELGYIANADTRDWDDPTEFKAWAQNRARAAIKQ